MSLVTNPSAADVFVCKLASNGTIAWVRTFGDPGSVETSGGMALDASGNCITVGGFGGMLDLDPGVGVVNRTSAGSTDGFVVKLSPSGAYVWGATVGNVSSDECKAVACDAMGNVYIAGMFIGAMDFDPGIGVANFSLGFSPNMFIWKLGPDGAYQWVRGVGGTFEEVPTCMDVSSQGSIFVGGVFSGPADFDPGTGVFNLSPIGIGARDAFCLKLDSTGAFAWARQIGHPAVDHAASIAADDGDNVYLVGHISGTVDLDPGMPIANYTSAGGRDAYVLALSASGTLQWAFGTGGTGHDEARGVALNASCNPVVVGVFLQTVDLDPGTNTANYTAGSAALSDGYVQQLTSSIAICTPTVLSVEWLDFTGVPEGTTTLLHWSTGSETNCERFIIERSDGHGEFQEIGSVNGSGNSTTTHEYAWYDLRPVRGVGYYRLRQINHDGTAQESSIIAIRSRDGTGDLDLALVAPSILRITLPTELKVDIRITLVDAQGRTVQQEAEFFDIEGAYLMRLNGLSAGTYVVRIESDAMNRTGRFCLVE